MLKKHGVKDDDINLFGNITVLNEQTNTRRLQSKWPAAYIRDFSIAPEDLWAHAVSAPFADAARGEKSILESTWSHTKYHDFVIDRSQELTKVANQFLGRLRGGS